MLSGVFSLVCVCQLALATLAFAQLFIVVLNEGGKVTGRITFWQPCRLRFKAVCSHIWNWRHSHCARCYTNPGGP